MSAIEHRRVDPRVSSGGKDVPFVSVSHRCHHVTSASRLHRVNQSSLAQCHTHRQCIQCITHVKIT